MSNQTIVVVNCSEKLRYEIAVCLKYPCARIELAKDENGTLGVLNYDFILTPLTEHTDIVAFLNPNQMSRKEFYTISNIKRNLDSLNKNLFFEFLKIMIFDALVGETDRHEENWGLTKKNNEYYISPLYDNGCSLLNKFKNEDYAQKYYQDNLLFENYILKSKTYIYKENSSKRYKHFELIEYLIELYPEEMKKEIKKLKELTNEKIEAIVNRIPVSLLTNMHKKYIIQYLKKRRDILLKMGENANDK